MIDSRPVSAAFGRAAPQYDRYADVQRAMARRVLACISHADPRSVLELGCGTGFYTKLLQRKFPEARLRAVELSPHMLTVARAQCRNNRTRFILSDAEYFRRGVYAVITANACVQWFGDLGAALRRYAAMLSRDGEVVFSTFGPRTFWQLQQVVQRVLPSPAPIAAAGFCDEAAVRRALAAAFSEVEIVTEYRNRSFGSLLDFFRSMRYSSGVRASGIFWTARRLRQAEELYRTLCNGKIVASYEIYYCRATQPKKI